jgi:hypothetical protein
MRDATSIFLLPEPSQDALRAHVDAFMEQPTFTRFARRDSDEILDDPGTSVYMYVNYDRWVGDCPHCNAGLTGVEGVAEVTCLDCGRRMTAVWPPPAAASEAARMLEYRLDERNRHWNPAVESVDDLKAENLQRGVRIV